MLKCVITDKFQDHKPIFGGILWSLSSYDSPLTVFYVFLGNHRESVTQTEWLSRRTVWIRVCVSMCVCECLHYRSAKRYAKCGIMVWHVWKWTQWLGLMTLWKPKVGIMSWKRHILDKPAGMVMEQTAGVRAQRWEILTVDLDLMDFIAAHLRLMKLLDTALEWTFLLLV